MNSQGIPPIKVKPNAFIGRRLLERSGDAHYLLEEDKVRFLPPAFFEKRPTFDISVDILWLEGNASERARDVAVAECASVAKTEGHDVFGWAGGRADALLRDAKDEVERIVGTPKPTNQRHGDIVALESLRIKTASDDLAKRKANIVAKALAEAYNKSGRFVPAPKGPAPSANTSDRDRSRTIHVVVAWIRSKLGRLWQTLNW